MISTNQFKNGNHIEVEGTVFKILEFQHVKPGKGGAFVRTKLRRTADGAVIDRTFRAGEKFRAVRTEARKMQFLYSDGTDAHFMDSESYEQIALPEESVKEPLQWIRPNETVDLLYIDDQPGDITMAPNPNFDGPYNPADGGYTGTLLRHCKQVPQSAAKPGDLVVSTVRRPCGKCPQCKAGENDMCSSGQYTERGIKGRHGYASERYRIHPEYLVAVLSLIHI